MKILGNHSRVWQTRRKRGKGVLEKTWRCQARERSSNIERFSIGGQANARGFYPYCVEHEIEVTLYNRHRVCGTNTLQRGARVLGARTSRKDLRGKVTLPWRTRTSAVGTTRDFFEKVTCSTHTPVIVITTIQWIVISLYASARAMRLRGFRQLL